MHDTVKMDVDRLHKRLRLRVAAFACHEQARERIASAIRNTQLASARIHFYAYFCECPGIWPSNDGDPAPHLIAPFIDYEIARRTLSVSVSPDATETDCHSYLRTVRDAIDAFHSGQPFRIPLAYTNPANVVKLWDRFALLGPLSAGKMANDLFGAWRADRTSNGATVIQHAFRARHCVDDMSAKLSSSVLTVAQKMAYVNVFALLYYALMTSSNADDCLFFVAAPLCTRRTFHGVLIAVVETPSGARKDFDSIRPILNRVGEALVKEANNTYLPTLILSQNSWEEHLLSEHLDAAERATIRAGSQSTNLASTDDPLKLFDACDDRVYSRLSASCAGADKLEKEDENELLEAALVRLWARRRRSAQGNVAGLKESLIFRKMMAASPGMISAIREVAGLGLDEPKEAPLQAVLVVAPPGSGKEMMSRLIPLFSSYFWDKPVRPVNMGSVLLETRERGGGLLGFLERLAKDELSSGGTLVLDELNSLDIAAQPMLLRVLEEGEIYSPSPTPETERMLSTERFSVTSPALASSAKPQSKRKPLPWLVVGLINEDPARLTLEALREKVTEPIFGGLLGSALYEHWKVKSRLRDDLYYRIRRCGEIRLRGLNDRRPDVPVVFYFRLRKLLRRPDDPAEVFLTYEAMHRLIDAALDWKGNMRKLEALARQMKGAVERQRAGETIIRIDEMHVERALQDVGMSKGMCATCGQRLHSSALRSEGGG